MQNNMCSEIIQMICFYEKNGFFPFSWIFQVAIQIAFSNHKISPVVLSENLAAQGGEKILLIKEFDSKLKTLVVHPPLKYEKTLQGTTNEKS